MSWKTEAYRTKGLESDQSGLECLSPYWLAVGPWAGCGLCEVVSLSEPQFSH